MLNEGLLRLDEGRPVLARHALDRAVTLAAGKGDSRLLRLDESSVHLDESLQVDG